MNRRDLEQMRQRLAARGTTEGEDHPALLILVAILFAVITASASFL